MLRRLATAAVLLFVCCAFARAEEAVHLTMGNPSKATKDVESKNNFLIVKGQFALSYNNSKGGPNWVSWHLSSEHLGNAKRQQFYPEALPPGYHRVTPKDYKFASTGMTRGHLCPRSDRTKSSQDSKATFTMANMVPQTEPLNGGAWNALEIYCRELAKDDDKELYIIAGGACKGGTSEKGYFNSLDGGKIIVPAKCWKVVMVLDKKDGDDVARVDRDTRLIAVIMPNDTTVHPTNWKKYRVSVAQVEELTGYTFFDNVAGDFMKDLKKEVDDE